MLAKTLLTLTLLSLLSITTTTLSVGPPTFHDILEMYSLPRGILPDSIKSYFLSPDDGSFVVELENPCYIQFDYLVYYDSKITGKLNVGSITDVAGIQVKRLFFRFNVDEIKVDLPSSENIYFTIGIIIKKLDIDQFKTVYACMDNALCGYSANCVNQLPTTVDEVEMLITE